MNASLLSHHLHFQFISRLWEWEEGWGRKEKGGFRGGRGNEQCEVPEGMGAREAYWSPWAVTHRWKAIAVAEPWAAQGGWGVAWGLPGSLSFVGLTVFPPHCGELGGQSARWSVNFSRAPWDLVQFEQTQNPDVLALLAKTYFCKCKIANEVKLHSA